MRIVKAAACLSVAGLLTLGTSLLWAAHFQPASRNHTAYGVSQYVAVSVADGRGFQKYFNPNDRAHIAATLVYERRTLDVSTPQGTGGLFLGCVLTRLSPHDSISIDQDADLPTSVNTGKLYSSVISVPRDTVTVAGRQVRRADGLGIIVDGSAGHPAHLTDPRFFTLPFDAVAAGQRQAAIDCVCDELAAGSLPLGLFSSFGIACS